MTDPDAASRVEEIAARVETWPVSLPASGLYALIREDVPWLLDRVRALEAGLEKLRYWVLENHNHPPMDDYENCMFCEGFDEQQRAALAGGGSS